MSDETRPNGAGAEPPMADKLGTVRIAPNVLATIASLTALAVPGVARLTDGSGGVGRLMGRGEQPGVRVEVREGQASVDLHLAARVGTNVVEVAEQVQRLVADAIPTMVGMPTAQINVFVDDVE